MLAKSKAIGHETFVISTKLKPRAKTAVGEEVFMPHIKKNLTPDAKMDIV